MQTHQKRLSVSMDLARILIRYASDHGVDGLKLWEGTGLSPRLLENGETRLSIQRFDALWRAVEKGTRDAHFGVKLGPALKNYAGGHLLYAVLMNSPTVASALEKFCRYHAIMSDVVQPRLIDTVTPPRIILEAPHPGITLSIGHHAFIFSLFASTIHHLTGCRGNILEVRFSGPPPDDFDVYRRVFDCPLKFGRTTNELLIAKNSLDQMVFLANPTLLSGLETMALKHVESVSAVNSVSDKTARAIRRVLIKGEKPFIRQVAKNLGMSTRLLQQKLRNEQTGFREILDRERMETAITLLKDNHNTIVDIAFLLGFSEQSSFTHAFQKWTGKTPGQFRKDADLNA